MDARARPPPRVRGPHHVGGAPSLPADATLADARALLEATKHKALAMSTDEPELYTYTRELDDDEIAAMWARKGMLASHMGTEGHWLCECFLNGLPVRWWQGELSVFFDFAREHLLPRGIVAWNTEKEITCIDADLAGSIDAIFYEPSTGMHHIVDFKETTKLIQQLHGYDKMRGELAHLDDCKGASYALQTSLYQYILERDYGMQIGDRILLSIHPDRPAATSVPYLHAEVDFLMRRRFALVRARKAVAADDPAFRCALTGAPLVDAVRLDDGKLVMEKIAQVMEREYEPDEPTRAAFEAAVAARLEPVEIFKADCVPWRKRMPKNGLEPFA